MSSTNVEIQQKTALFSATKKPCLVCGKLVTTSNMARHQKSRACLNHNGSKLPDVSKTACNICGQFVTISNMARHQKSKRCMRSGKPSHRDQLKKVGIKPAAESKMCWVCETAIEKSHWTRHVTSQQHRQKMGLQGDICISEETKQRIADRKAPRLPAPELNLARLVEKYPKRKIERRAITNNRTENILEMVTRKPTRPNRIDSNIPNPSPEPVLLPVSPGIPQNEGSFDYNEMLLNEVIFSENHYSDCDEEQFQKIINDFDLSFLDEPENEPDLFEPPRRVVNPDSERIRQILGPPPFEYQTIAVEDTDYEQNPLTSLSYLPPPHSIENTVYSPVSLTDKQVAAPPPQPLESVKELTSKKKKPCSKCGKLVDKSNVPRHQRSRACKPQTNAPLPFSNSPIIPQRQEKIDYDWLLQEALISVRKDPNWNEELFQKALNDTLDLSFLYESESEPSGFVDSGLETIGKILGPSTLEPPSQW